MIYYITIQLLRVLFFLGGVSDITVNLPTPPPSTIQRYLPNSAKYCSCICGLRMTLTGSPAKVGRIDFRKSGRRFLFTFSAPLPTIPLACSHHRHVYNILYIYMYYSVYAEKLSITCKHVSFGHYATYP